MISRSTLLSGLCVIAAAAALNGCGNDAGTVVTGPSGRLTQGPVLGATVFADNVSAGVRFTQDSNEVTTTTDVNTGDFTLPTVPGYNYILVSKGGHDKLTGLAAMQMIAPAGSKNITPLTTLVALDTTGTVKAKLEALMPVGFTYDSDISTTASPAVLLVAKSVESLVQSMTAAIVKSGSGTVSDLQLATIQAQVMQSITQGIAAPAVTATTLSAPATLTDTLVAAAKSAAASIQNSNLTVPAGTAATIASNSVSATATALNVVTSASTTGVTGGEAAAITPSAATAFAGTVTATGNTASSTISASTTLSSYTPPPVTVVTPPTVGVTGATGGTTGGTGQSF